MRHSGRGSSLAAVFLPPTSARSSKEGPRLFDEGLFQTFTRERVLAAQLPEERAGEWRVSGYESCTAGPASDESPPSGGLGDGHA